MRFSKPSFRTKNSLTVVISPSGKYLAQFGQRISIYEIEKRKIIAEHKVITNDSYIGFSPDEQVMFSKNTNGEIVFFETLTGKQISSTGKFKHYGEGSLPSFSVDGSLLFDPSWKEGLKVWSAKNCELINNYDFKDWGLSGLIKISNLNKYAFFIESKHPNVGHSKLFTFKENLNEITFDEIKPNEKLLTKKNWYSKINWCSIDTFAMSNFQNNLLFVASPKKGNQILAVLDLENNKQQLIEMENSKQYITSLTMNSILIVAVVHTNVFEQDMSSTDYFELNSKTETEHLIFYDAITLELICKINWPDLNSICLHPNGKGIALASHNKSGYIDDFTKLSKKLESYS